MNRKNELFKYKTMTKNASISFDQYIDSMVNRIAEEVTDLDKTVLRADIEVALSDYSCPTTFKYKYNNTHILYVNGTYDEKLKGNKQRASFTINTAEGETKVFIYDRYDTQNTTLNQVTIEIEDGICESNFKQKEGSGGTFYYCSDEIVKFENKETYYIIDGTRYKESDIVDQYNSFEEINCDHADFESEVKIKIIEEDYPERFEAYKRCCKKKESVEPTERNSKGKRTQPKRPTKSTPTLETEPETKIPEDYIFPDFANDPEEESGIGRRKKPQVQPELDTDIDNMIEDVERKRGFFPTNADVKGIMRGESFINFREQDTRGKEVISEMQKLMRDAGANIQPDGSFGKEMKEKLSNLLSKPISFLGKEQYLKLAEMAHEKGKTNWLIGYVAANEGVSPEEYYELMNNKETRKEMVSALKEEGLGRLRTLIKNRRSARSKGIPRSKRRRFFRR